MTAMTGRQALQRRRLQLPRAEPRALLEARRLHHLQVRGLRQAGQVARHLLVPRRRHALQDGRLRQDRGLARPLLGSRRRCVVVIHPRHATPDSTLG